MIQMQTILGVADNSGAKRVCCIKVLKSKKFAGIADLIKVSVKEAAPRTRVKKGEIYLAVIVRAKCGVTRSDGTFIRFDDNAVVLLNEQKQPVGTRVSGAVTRELRAAFMKIVSLADEVL